ncbi:uncharacterized protein LOC123891805 [Trifolium pratense]|uniref:uncharacterized protein LOC123891805 n=1 Tax=Trifolium pratense TaxID=57577 RepID=UPI001E68FF5D|nr:uncharacterized protein LOC123891805 [Trifolium pratense]
MLKIESFNTGLESYSTFIFGLNSNSIELPPSPYDEEEITFFPGFVQIQYKSLKSKSCNSGLKDYSTFIPDLNSNSIDLLSSSYDDEEEITFIPDLIQIQHESLELKSSNNNLEDRSTFISSQDLSDEDNFITYDEPFLTFDAPDEDNFITYDMPLLHTTSRLTFDDDNDNDDNYNGDDEYDDDD